MEDVLNVYERPNDPRYPLVCLDEICKQLTKEVIAPIPLKPGHPMRFEHQYERNGTCNLFMVFEPFVGHRRVLVTERRTKVDWAYAIQILVDEMFPDAKKIVLVMDNLNTHTPASLYEAYDPAEARRLTEKLDIHYTPKNASWLNVAEIENSVLARQCLNRRIPDIPTMKAEISAWEKLRNERNAGVDWRFTAKDARVKLKHLYPKA
jgi:hypothetical protein